MKHTIGITAHSPSDPDRAIYDRTLLGRIERRWLGRIEVRRALLLAAAVALIVPSIQFVLKIQETEYSEFRERVRHRTAIGRWLPDALALQQGGDPYGDKHWFPNPPLVLIALVPFAHLPIVVTAVAWSALKITAVVVGCWCAVRAGRQQAGLLPGGVMIMVAVFAARPIMADITHGNINIFVFLELAIAWYLFVIRQDVMAGVMVGLAVVTKVTPALLLIYFLYKRAWRVVAGGGLGLVLFGFVVPSLIVGPGRNYELSNSWYRLMVQPYVEHGFVTLEPKNQSLPGTLMRMLNRVGWMEVESAEEVVHAAGEKDSVEEDFGTELGALARPATVSGSVVLRGANLALLVLLAWLCRAPQSQRRNVRLLLELSLVLVAMLLLSERTWKHHLTTLPLIYLPCWLVLTRQWWPPQFNVLFCAGLAVQFALLVLLKGTVALYVGVITWGLLLCFIQNAILLRRLAKVQH